MKTVGIGGFLGRFGGAAIPTMADTDVKHVAEDFAVPRRIGALAV
jgi:hypothetical protein